MSGSRVSLNPSGAEAERQKQVIQDLLQAEEKKHQAIEELLQATPEIQDIQECLHNHPEMFPDSDQDVSVDPESVLFEKELQKAFEGFGKLLQATPDLYQKALQECRHNHPEMFQDSDEDVSDVSDDTEGFEGNSEDSDGNFHSQHAKMNQNTS